MFWKGVVGYLPVNIVQGVVGLLTIIVFTRLLTPEAYGVYALAFSAMSLAHTGLFTWAEAAMARFQAREGKTESAAHHFATLYRTIFGLAVVVPLICGAALWFAPVKDDLRIALAAGLIAIPLRSLVKLAQERRRADGEVGSAAALDIVQTLGAFGVGAGLAWMGMGGAAPMLGLLAAAAVCALWALPSELKLSPGGALDAARLREYAGYGVPVALSMILALALATADRFLIAGYLGEAAVGVYHAGYSLSNRTLDVLFIWLGMAGGPAAVAALERGGRPALKVQAREQVALMLLICLPAAVGLALVARPLADVMVGAPMRDGAAAVTPWIAASGLFA
ncbi:MAG: lipopolysaccharide biosynthesis protein, partial [Caulobacteraceae bacterium]